MKSKNLVSILLIGFVLSLGLNGYLFYSLDRLQKQFDDQSEIIKKYDEIYKKLKSGDNDLLSAIDNFFENIPTYVDGKEVSSIDYISHNARLNDSLRLYKDYYDYSKDNYGVDLKRIETSDSTYRIVSDPPTKADTAKLLVPHYSNMVYRKGNDWYTITSNFEKLYDQQLSENNDLVLKHNKLLKDQLNVLTKANKKIKEYHDILIKLDKEGVIKLDTSGD